MANPFRALFQSKPKAASAPKTGKAPKAAKPKAAKAGKADRKSKVPARLEFSSDSAEIAELFQSAPVKATDETPGGLPRFHTMAGDQFGPLRSDRFANLRLKVRNVFTPSQPVADPRMFAGRRGVLEQMIRAIEDQRLNLVAYGDRGIGKTSLLHTLAEAAREARYIVVYWSCGATSNFDETFRAVAAEIPLLFHSRYSPTTVESESGSTLADLLPNTRISPRIFGELAAKITGTRVLIVLDEFDRSDSADFRREVAELIKIMSDRSVRVSVVIAGVGADLAELVEHIPSIRRNILAFPIQLMSADEVREIVENGEKAAGVSFTPPARDMCVWLAHGSPYLASLICHHSALSSVDAERTQVTPTDVGAGVEQAASELYDRLPRRIQTQVDRLIERGGSRLLSVLADASLSSSGEFDDAAIGAATSASVEAAQARRLAEELSASGELMRRDEKDGRKFYAFVEEGLPAFLWMMGAERKIAGEIAGGAEELRSKAI